MFYHWKRRHGFNEKFPTMDFEKLYFERLRGYREPESIQLNRMKKV
jgi:hypothetical protein